MPRPQLHARACQQLRRQAARPGRQTAAAPVFAAWLAPVLLRRRCQRAPPAAALPASTSPTGCRMSRGKCASYCCLAMMHPAARSACRSARRGESGGGLVVLLVAGLGAAATGWRPRGMPPSAPSLAAAASTPRARCSADGVGLPSRAARRQPPVLLPAAAPRAAVLAGGSRGPVRAPRWLSPSAAAGCPALLPCPLAHTVKARLGMQAGPPLLPGRRHRSAALSASRPGVAGRPAARGGLQPPEQPATSPQSDGGGGSRQALPPPTGPSPQSQPASQLAAHSPPHAMWKPRGGPTPANISRPAGQGNHAMQRIDTQAAPMNGFGKATPPVQCGNWVVYGGGGGGTEVGQRHSPVVGLHFLPFLTLPASRQPPLRSLGPRNELGTFSGLARALPHR